MLKCSVVAASLTTSVFVQVCPRTVVTGPVQRRVALVVGEVRVGVR